MIIEVQDAGISFRLIEIVAKPLHRCLRRLRFIEKPEDDHSTEVMYVSSLFNGHSSR